MSWTAAPARVLGAYRPSCHQIMKIAGDFPYATLNFSALAQSFRGVSGYRVLPVLCWPGSRHWRMTAVHNSSRAWIAVAPLRLLASWQHCQPSQPSNGWLIDHIPDDNGSLLVAVKVETMPRFASLHKSPSPVRSSLGRHDGRLRGQFLSPLPLGSRNTQKCLPREPDGIVLTAESTDWLGDA